MRCLVATSLVLLATAGMPRAGFSQPALVGDQGLTGAREIGIFGSGRLLSTDYSAEGGKSAFGGVVTFGTHFSSMLGVQAGMGVNYSRQELTYYKPPLWTFTPTISLVLQRSSGADLQPYGLIGGGYEFVRYTHPRCDCEQSRSLGIGHVGAGVRKMLGQGRAFRTEVSSQIGKGGPAFTGMAGVSFFLGTPTKRPVMRPPDRVRTEPPLIPVPAERTTVTPARPPVPPPPPPPPAAPAPVPSNDVTRPPPESPLPRGIGAVLLSFDGTQVDFTRPTWRDEAEPLLDGLAVDLTSDAGLGIRISIEAHTDNVGSNAANMMIGLDRARAVREYLVSQGVAADRIRIGTSGEDSPIAPNTTAIGRQQNRRVIIKRDN